MLFRSYCAGDNRWGQTGSDINPGVNYLRDYIFASTAASANHACGLTPGGAAWCWGKGSEGQLGNGTYVASSAQPVSVTPGRVFTSLAADAASNHTCGLGTSGDAWCWGYNYFGQLGTGDTANRANPVAVGGGLTFASLAVGGNHTCGLTHAGVAWCWGLNVNGQLGDGSRANRTTPGLVATSGNVVVPVTATPTVGPAPSVVPTTVPGTAVGARSVRVTNVTDTSFTVSWATDRATTGTIRWGPDDGTTPATVANDRRGASTVSTVHYVTVSGRTPSSRYRFDVVSDSTVDANGGAHYVATTGSTLAITTPSLTYGTVSLRDGGVPSGVIVQVVASGSNGTSAPLTDLIVASDQRTWAVNLGNLRTATLDAPFAFTDATVLTVTADGGADGSAVGTVTVADALTGSLSLTMSDEVTVSLQTGWNLVALRANPASPMLVPDACRAINATATGAAVEVNRWIDSGWEGHFCALPPHRFAIEAGEGYFVRMSAPATWTYRGTLLASPVTRSLGAGWNLVGASAVSGTPSTAAGSCAHLNAAQAGTAIEVDRWIDGGWEGHRCGLPPNDFTLEAGRGYFIRLVRPATWAPTGASPVSASAVQR